MKYRKIIATVVLAGAVLMTGCGAERADKDAFLLGTICSARVYGSESEEALNAAFERVSQIERVMSLTLPESELNAVNSSSEGVAVSISDELIGVLEKSSEYERLTDGRFSITLGEISQLWNITSENPVIPDSTMIEEALRQTGAGAYTLDGTNKTVTRNTAAVLDLGGIAKGFAADEVRSVLSEYGIENAIVSLGGNIIAMGTDSARENEPWLVGIANPRVDGELIATIAVSDKFVVTSGDYERYFMLDGVRYHHIIDPETGRPAQNGIISATIIADNSALADALSTAVFIMGSERALSLLNSIDGVEAVLITEALELVTTDGMGKYDLEEVNDAKQ